MVHHVVTWKLKASAGPRDQVAAEVRRVLEALAGRIPGLVSLTVGVNANPAETSADVALVTVHESWAALDAYQTHPEHLKAAALIGQVRETRTCVDWED